MNFGECCQLTPSDQD